MPERGDGSELNKDAIIGEMLNSFSFAGHRGLCPFPLFLCGGNGVGKIGWNFKYIHVLNLYFLRLVW